MGLRKTYLVAYNFASLIGWAYALYLLTTVKDSSRSFEKTGDIVTYVQTMAVLEIFHALLGLVKTPVITTIIQVFSRLTLVWLICYNFNQTSVTKEFAYSSMVFAWSVTEIIRYSYYGLNLLGFNPKFLVWCRYTFFYLLYPIGAGSEWILIYKSLDLATVKFGLNAYYAFVALLIIYVPGFYVMYTHMIVQRKKYLNPKNKVDNFNSKSKSKKLN
ncbi:hypothetical protein HDU92_008250 [Lobulomyces angularis]|nr:hypothetical protein HDU92_008250 [Lobulomyces angularis]